VNAGDPVTVKSGGRVSRAVVVYVRGKSVRVAMGEKGTGIQRTVPVERVEVVRSASVHAGRAFLAAAAALPPEAKARLAEAPCLRPVPKPPKPWRSESYRAFVRSQPTCCCCGVLVRAGDDLGMEAHHHGPHAMGEKGDDAICIPLLRRCHRYFHDHGTFEGMDRTETDAVAKHWQATLLTAWCHLHLGSTETDAVVVDALVEALRKERAA
jgi:hypothetical protein